MLFSSRCGPTVPFGSCRSSGFRLCISPTADGNGVQPQPQLWCVGLLFSSGVSPRAFGAAGSIRVCPSVWPRLPLEELLAFVPT